ncbi:Probable polygalacturonase At3g15720 [Linum grandiflorum]
MAAPTTLLLISLLCLAAQSGLCYRSRDQDNYINDYRSTDDARRYIDGFLDYVAAGTSSTSFNVLRYGAVGDGVTDSSKAFLKAWDDFCGAAGQPSLVIPDKVFFLKPVVFFGPCKSRKLRIEEDKGYPRATALSFQHCNNLLLSTTSHVNSQKKHITLHHCKGVEISNVRIIAPESSPNTDGIHMSASSQVNIHDSFIGTGDDCVAINGFSSLIHISRVMCGPGHGISIGSLGENGVYETVEDVHVEDCTFRNTMNGARIKTWKGGRGYVRNVRFEKIALINTGNPIIIDQGYINRMASGEYYSSGNHVEISEVTYREVRGTSSDQMAVNFNCAGGSGCKNIVVENVEIRAAEQGKGLFAVCNNAHGRATSGCSPRISCLVP